MAIFSREVSEDFALVVESRVASCVAVVVRRCYVEGELVIVAVAVEKLRATHRALLVGFVVGFGVNYWVH